jgi:hypothetical protein
MRIFKGRNRLFLASRLAVVVPSFILFNSAYLSVERRKFLFELPLDLDFTEERVDVFAPLNLALLLQRYRRIQSIRFHLCLSNMR